MTDKLFEQVVLEDGWMAFLESIILEYRGSDEPLDGDEVERLVQIIEAKVNLHEGNITFEEYQDIIENGLAWLQERPHDKL